MKNFFILEDEIYQYPRKQILAALQDHNLTVATSFYEAKDLFKGPYDVLLLDHDMRGFFDPPEYKNTGYQFVKWMLTKRISFRPKILLHSHNPEGRQAMRDLLLKSGFHVEEHYFNQDYVEMLLERFGG